MKMQRHDYGVASCTGEDNVRKAIEAKINDGWEVHSIAPNGVAVFDVNPLSSQPQKAVLPKFLVLFWRLAEEEPSLEILA